MSEEQRLQNLYACLNNYCINLVDYKKIKDGNWLEFSIKIQKLKDKTGFTNPQLILITE